MNQAARAAAATSALAREGGWAGAWRVFSCVGWEMRTQTGTGSTSSLASIDPCPARPPRPLPIYRGQRPRVQRPPGELTDWPEARPLGTPSRDSRAAGSNLPLELARLLSTLASAHRCGETRLIPGPQGGGLLPLPRPSSHSPAPPPPPAQLPPGTGSFPCPIP